jgi:hypothetical protein
VRGWKISPSQYLNQDLATAWLDQCSKIRLHITQRVLHRPPWLEAMRTGNFHTVMNSNCNCNSVVNPLHSSEPFIQSKIDLNL